MSAREKPSARSAPDRAEPGHVADAPAGNWVDRYAPSALRPYLRLMRADRPIGTWLLLFPCWWSAALAEIARSQAVTPAPTFPDPWTLVLFAIGAFVMRGAGCAYNDFVDRDFDAQVARTRSRPLPSGQVKPWQALALVAALGFAGLAVLLQFNGTTIALGIASLALVLVYPFMKRLTYWPQVILGLTFNWGALVGWTAVTGSLALAPALLYAGAVTWTVAYDTIYAHQDKEDDLMLGLKSTAIRFGDATVAWVGGLFAATVVLWSAAALMANAGFPTFAALAVIAIHFGWQTATLDIGDAGNCLTRFRANRTVGIVLFAGLLADLALR
ncbi:MAG: 4-hydroxybenzoate octaprenyltransferase [Hyphomicrobiaceae bacterium]|nr:4-hydroxybenzoate octaprenyltransferase [Hyphomicrobiaceae bacterium]